ncbi:MAG: T9SS type A sorting domain-containing protein [Cryomorphaceae bacterium]|nr:T9SS type A sorting domain-containing protein [Cryomorphaceae bacterium]
MRSTFIILILLISTARGFAFCDGFPTITAQPQTCGDNTLTLIGSPGLFGCPSATSMYYQWTGTNFNGSSTVIEEGTVLGSSPYSVNLAVSATTPFANVCLYMEVYNEAGEIESTGTACNSNFNPLPTFDPATSFNWSCDGSCFSLNFTTQAMYSYSYQLDGQPMNIGQLFNATCPDAGMHTFSITGNGCTVTDTFEILNVAADNNTSCESAIPLVDGVFTADDACIQSTVYPECNIWAADAENWFSFNSGDNVHVNVAMDFEDYHIFNLQLWEETIPGDCSSLEILDCSYITEIPGCILMTDTTLLNPNTNYYLQVLSQVGFEYEILINLSNDGQSVCGCTDASSCFYDPEAILNDGNCGYAGCTNPSACNYEPWFTCDDGSCILGDSFVAQLYHDVNGDGIWQTIFFGEPALGNTGSIYITELDVTLYPNDAGQFNFPNIETGAYTITYTDNSGVWNLTTGDTFTLTLPTCDGAHIGLIPASNTLVQVSGPCCIWSMDIHCVNGFNPGLWLQNTGTVPLNGTFVMTFNANLFAEQLTNAEPFDTYTPGILTWDIVDQQPGESVLYQCHIQGPGATYAGQVFPFDMQMELIDENGNVAVSQDWLLEPTVVCSYDPNDKYCVPEGYAEPHFILGTEELEYRIRFQNTGDSYAQNVLVVDQLDATKLDISTFNPVFASHDYSTILNGNGQLEFHFDNIVLPDSATDEPGSQGYVVFRIQPLAGLIGGDVINNTASIYFDDNDPIITNTTYHTIFDCAWMGALPAEDEVCETYVSPDMTYEYAETYFWDIDGLSGGSNSPQETFTFIPGEHTVGVTISNPLCSVYSETLVTVNPNPQVEITVNGNELSVPAENTYQWYLNGNWISDAVGNTFIANEAGAYTVLAFNEWGCTFLSEPVVLIGIEDRVDASFSVYPNPAEDLLQLELPAGVFSIEIYNILGELVVQKTTATASFIDVSNLVDGAYIIKAVSDNTSFTARFIVER